MKIYNEITTKFNENTGRWETLSEDSFNHDGDLMELMPPRRRRGGRGRRGGRRPARGWRPRGAPANAIFLDMSSDGAGNTTDKITETIKVTEGYFTNGDGTIEGPLIHTASKANSNEAYYYDVCNAHPGSASSETQFSVTWGHIEGSGSDQYGDTGSPTGLKGQSQAIYKQFANLMLLPSEISGGFHIQQSGAVDKHIYVLIGKRERMKDKLNKKAWTLRLAGWAAAAGAQDLHLTDDSAAVAGVSTVAGPRYNIVSGSAGSVKVDATTTCYGHLYPEMGAMVFSGATLATAIPGFDGTAAITASFLQDPGGPTANEKKSTGFTPNLFSKGNPRNALRLVNCMRYVGAGATTMTLRLRSEEDQTQLHYFCRVKAGQMNHSNNPTFTSGSNKNKIRNKDMRGNPQTFITGVGLWNAGGQLVAIAKLSSPLKKNFSSESTIKIKLTY